MSMATAHPEVSSYLSALRAHLEDLPQEERDDLLEDLEQHLAEVAAEADGSLVERLGPPEAYAAELRSSVGLSPGVKRGFGERLIDRAERSLVGRLVRGVTSNSAYDQLRSFLGELRPGWWVLRGYVAVVTVIVFLESENQFFPDIPVPRLFGSQVSGLAAIVGGIWGSVAFGRRASRKNSARQLSVLLSLIVAGAGLLLVARLQDISAAAAAANYQEEVVEYFPEFLHHPDGSPIANICAYRSDGRRLKDVLLFDQDGRPITEVAPVIGQEQLPVERTLPKGKDGQRIVNAYPHELMVRDPDTGELEALPCPSVLVPPQEPADEAPDRRSHERDAPAVGPEAGQDSPVDPEPVPVD